MPSDSAPATILVLDQSTDRWFASAAALAEILHLEGINDLETGHLEDLTAAALEGRSLVLVAPADPAPEAVELLLEHVDAGGGLIAVAPGENFAERLALTHSFRGQMHARVQVPVDGFPDRGLPTRGWSQEFSTSGVDVTEIAPLLDANGKPTGSPAIIELKRGRGTIIVIACDLGATVYQLRQGDPALAGCRTTGIKRMRPADLFATSWNAADAMVPMADLHCHLLRELVHRAWPVETVLPWLWYFPHGADTMLLWTSDDDWSTRQQFEALIGACDDHGAGMSFYLVRDETGNAGGGTTDSVVDRAWLEELAPRGYDFSIHPNLPPPTGSTWRRKLASHVEWFKRRYDREPSSSLRNHSLAWAGYLDGPRVEAELGFRYDCNYYSVPPEASYYMAASGFPMPFVAPAGDVLPIYQLPAPFSDETTLSARGKADYTYSLHLPLDGAVKLVTGMVADNASRHHSMMCINSHPVSFATYSGPLWTQVMADAKSRGIPMWGVDRFDRFWEARRRTRLRPVPRDRAAQTTDALPEGLSAFIPVDSGGTRVIHGRAHRQISPQRRNSTP